MKLSERDKWLAILLPTVLVAAVYGPFFLRGKWNELTKAEAAMADARQKAPRPHEEAAQAARLAALTKENMAAQAKLQALEGQWRYATAFSSGADRNDRVEKLTALLHKYHLHFLEDSEADSAKDAKVSAAIERLAQKVAQSPTNHKPQVRRIRFQGRYADVHRALDDLAQGDVLAIPVGLTMKTTDDPARREWLLLIWI